MVTKVDDVRDDSFETVARGLTEYRRSAGVRRLAADYLRLLEENKQLRIDARTDPVTHVPNRRFFDEAVERAYEGRDAFAILMVDLNGFKAVNDRYGHAAGDYVLRAVAAAIKAHVREYDSIARITDGDGEAEAARLGGDEFGIVIPSRPNHPTAESPTIHRQAAIVANRLGTTIADAVAPREYVISASIGGAVYDPAGPEQARTAADLKEYADRAMYVAKRSGQAFCSWEDPAVRQLWE